MRKFLLLASVCLFVAACSPSPERSEDQLSEQTSLKANQKADRKALRQARKEERLAARASRLEERARRRGKVEEFVNDSIPALGFWVEDYKCEEGVINSGETFSSLMNRLGMGTAQAYKLALASDSLFNVTKIIAGNKYQVYSDTLTHEIKYMVYNINRVRSAVFTCSPDSLMGVHFYEKPVKVERRYADVSISSSLWNDMQKAGSSPALIIKLSDIYAWTVDFFGLQKDDRFQVIYEQSSCEGSVLSVDTIYFARFSRGEHELFAVMYDQRNNGNVYWNEKGESMRKAFLKAPLEFKRISSGFSYHRKHPVTGQIKAHTAVDYAAPTGTPVVSIGDGQVISVGWAGGGGNTVKVRHNSIYTTSYMHLSKYGPGIKAGVRVRQGQVIGYVGMTGTATGPHLDFRVYMNGTAINPLTMESPSEEPILPENKAGLDSAFVRYLSEMEQLAAEQDQL